MARGRTQTRGRTADDDAPVTLSYGSALAADSAHPAIPVISDWKIMAALGVLLIATVLAFSRCFVADFVRWDDPDYVMFNKLLRTPAGLWEIWNPRSPDNQQFYPLVFTTYWLEYRAWRLDARGYHAVNLLLHLVNVVLVAALMRKFGQSRWIAIAVAAVFALHPTQVASVVWISERKNTLSGIFYMVAFMLYLRHRRTGRWWPYAVCLLTFIAALLSKTQMLTLPLSLFLADWLLQSQGRIRRRSLALTALLMVPMLGLGAGFAKVTTSVEKTKGPSKNPETISTLEQRPLVVTTAAWFYAGSFLAPVDLAPVYRRWQVPHLKELGGHLKWLLAPLGWIAALAALVWFREAIGGSVLWGMAHFFIILAPALGVIPFNYQQYAFVADHFLYLACIGGGLALAVLADRLAREPRPALLNGEPRAAQPPAATSARGPRRTAPAAKAARSSTPSEPQAASPPVDDPFWSPRRIAVTIAGVILLAACGVKTHFESRWWNDNETFWLRAIAKNDICFPAFYNLGNHYARQNPPRWDKSEPLYQRATVISPTSVPAFDRYANAVLQLRGAEAAIAVCEERVRTQTDVRSQTFAGALKNLQSYVFAARGPEALADAVVRVAQERPECEPVAASVFQTVVVNVVARSGGRDVAIAVCEDVMSKTAPGSSLHEATKLLIPRLRGQNAK